MKLKEFFQKKAVKRLTAVVAICVLACMMCVGAFAEETVATNAVVAGVETVTEAVTGEFSITTIAEIIGVVLAGCVGLFLFWWGARKVVRMITSAFKKGKISL